MQQRTEELSYAIQNESLQQRTLILECLEVLRSAMEELQVAQEELRQQNDELLQAQEVVQAERQRYQTLFEFTPAAYLVTDLYGTVREANQIAALLLQIPQHFLVGKPLTVFVPSLQHRSFRTLLNQLPSLLQPQAFELELETWKKNSFHADIQVDVVRNSCQQVVALRWLIIDATDRKQSEKRLQEVQMQNLELREVDRLKDEFMRTVSHELRTPMTAILGFSELLRQRFVQSPDPQTTMMIECITRNSRHLLQLVEEILDFSKLQEQQLQLCLEEFDLTELLQATTSELQSLAAQKNLAFNLILPSENVMVVNDRLRLRQVVINLISNAIKFTHEGGITIELLELPEGRIAVSVRDTGIGIAPEHQAQIFQEFWQVDQSTSRCYQGTGLGLSISKQLITLMQGSLSVESESGQGTLFRVEMPCCMAIEQSQTSKSFC
ncbi:PAS domain-containing sensor histidine kinase [Leptolyngbya sp. GB1-A1]|uniref:sensor histidine kinase n=1 Tax=Leptolyngbya sp. GB1-A1 TaxID=2933908 RepID=UPI003297BDD6